MVHQSLAKAGIGIPLGQSGEPVFVYKFGFVCTNLENAKIWQFELVRFPKLRNLQETNLLVAQNKKKGTRDGCTPHLVQLNGARSEAQARQDGL